MGEGAVAMEAEREKDDGSRGPSDVATSQGGWAASRSWRKKPDAPLEPHKEHSPAITVSLALKAHFSLLTSDLQNIKSVWCVKPLSL